MKETIAGIEYTKPQVYLLQETGIGTAEYAARTCYNSFDKSENGPIKGVNYLIDENMQPPHVIAKSIADVNNIGHSDLLDDLAWTYFHHSILEHANLTYTIKGTSRGVLQEHARHRMQGISVQSTRYTMSPIINAFIAHLPLTVEADELTAINKFTTFVEENIQYLVTNNEYNHIEHTTVWSKLMYQYNKLGKVEFMKLATTKAMRETILIGPDIPKSIFEKLQACKQKRNVGDSFKHIVTDNWKVDMVVTMNLRALKNYLELRDSGAAYFQIQWLAQAMVRVTPKKYLNLISKKYKEN